MMNWRQIYGDDEFSVKPPIYWSDIIRRQERRKVDLEDLKRRAAEYAKKQCESYNVNYDEVIKGESPIEWPPMKKEVDLEARVERGRKTQAKTETSEPDDLPVGWATAKDSNGRVYYWHKETKATQWNKPTT